jgi:hypothetical protein
MSSALSYACMRKASFRMMAQEHISQAVFGFEAVEGASLLA